jgi:hypothetical protein
MRAVQVKAAITNPRIIMEPYHRNPATIARVSLVVALIGSLMGLAQAQSYQWT